MPIAGYSTTVDAAKTAAEVSAMLAKRGASRIMTEYGDGGRATGLSFEIRAEYGVRGFELPIRAQGVLETLKRDRAEKRYLTIEQAEKVAWRLVRDWLRAQLALIDAGSVSLDEVFFPWMIAGERGTMHEIYVSQQKAIES
jgi:hypothetical protein